MKALKDQEYDAIVVGTGPGGATVAKELTRKKRSVLILEWGSNEPVNGTKAQAIRNLGIPGKSALFTNEMLTMVRGITTGGSSIYYYGTAFYPPVEMLKRYNIRIEDEIENVKAELPVAPLADRLLGPMAKRIMESARELGYDWQKQPKFIDQENCRPDCEKCGYGCPHQAKWTARKFVEKAREKGARLINNARVTKILIENGKARGVEFRHHHTTRSAFAKQVILAAGGIGSPVILRASGISGAGRNFFYDPLIAVMGTGSDIKGGREIPMAAGIHMEDEGYLMTDMTLPASIYGALTAQAGRINQLFNHPNTLTIMIKAKDSLGGYLSDSGGVRKRLADSDRKKLSRGYKRAGQILRNAGAKNIFKSNFLAAHPGGTVKINELINSDLETEIQNLFVCDCSVIPEAWGLPPTFTLVCLGKRLVKHMDNSQ